MLKALLLAISIICSLPCYNAEGKRPRSALKWITKKEAENLPDGLYNADFVHPNEDKPWVTFCRAEMDGCYYPGQAYIGSSGIQICKVIGKKIVTLLGTRIIKNYQLLYNPGGVSEYTWQAGYSTSHNAFPPNVVKSDEQCNLMIGRYHDYDENALIDAKGYVYYHHGSMRSYLYAHTKWDNNEYDILLERTVKKIELLELNYDQPQNQKTNKFEGEGDKSNSNNLLANFDTKETEMSTSLSMTYTDHKSWSHSVEMCVAFGVEVEVTSPGKALLGGASANYKFETSFSYSHGWNKGNEKSRTATQTVTKKVQPRTRIRVKMFMVQHTEDVPFTAKYRLTYEDGSSKIVSDKGVMKNVFYTDSQVEVEKAEPI